MVTVSYMSILVASDIPLKQNLALQFCRNRNKEVSILIETHMNLDQVHHIRNNWLDAIVFSPEDRKQKDCLPCFIWVLKVSLRFTLIQKGGLFALRLLRLMTRVFCFYAPSQHSTKE